jgi:hypothetical protein
MPLKTPSRTLSFNPAIHKNEYATNIFNKKEEDDVRSTRFTL